MAPKPPAKIEEMQTLFYADVASYKSILKKFMLNVPAFFVVLYEPEDKSYCILGTDENFENWEHYTNYAFRDLQPALELPDTVFRLPDDFRWLKV